MKPKRTTITIIAGLLAAVMLPGCATPAGRQDTRVDRRQDAGDRTYQRADARAGRVDDRSTTRQGNRDDRQSDRTDRVDTRYGY